MRASSQRLIAIQKLAEQRKLAAQERGARTLKRILKARAYGKNLNVLILKLLNLDIDRHLKHIHSEQIRNRIMLMSTDVMYSMADDQMIQLRMPEPCF